MKQILMLVIVLIIYQSCERPGSKLVSDKIKGKTMVSPKTAVLTDSSRLLKHLDSLDTGKSTINISEFKSKILFNLPYKRIPTQIGGGQIDYDDQDTSFNLTDSNYNADWTLIKKTKKFIVIIVDGKLATLNYNLDLIDAINIEKGDPASNPNYQADREATIGKDLTILLKHSYVVRVDEKNHFDYQTSREKWFIDKTGHIRKNKLKTKNLSDFSKRL